MDKKVFFRPCPFCNGEVEVTTKRKYFDEQVEKIGESLVKVECRGCDVEMWQFGEKDYDIARVHLARKWNKRGDEYEIED